jgi:hypothetical protein
MAVKVLVVIGLRVRIDEIVHGANVQDGRKIGKK